MKLRIVVALATLALSTTPVLAGDDDGEITFTKRGDDYTILLANNAVCDQDDIALPVTTAARKAFKKKFMGFNDAFMGCAKSKLFRANGTCLVYSIKKCEIAVP